jgi:hypothetical protein
MKKILSIVIGIVFLMNNLCFADLLSPESHLAPPNTPELLDIMKLTAGIMQATKGRNLADPQRNFADVNIVEADRIGDTGHKEVQREGDIFTYKLRDALVFDDGRLIFFSCSIDGVQHGATDFSERNYIGCAKKNETGYDFEFYTESEVGMSYEALYALRSNEVFETIAKFTRGPEIKQAIARFVEQQNETDMIIADTIKSGFEIHLPLLPSAEAAIYGTKWITDAYDFIKSFNPDLAEDLARLFDSGQVMIIPKLEKSHAGGIGIYLTKFFISTDVRDDFLRTKKFVHEIFAKAGLTHKECETMKDICRKQSQFPAQQLSDSEKEVLAKAEKARFENRWDDLTKVDYHHSMGHRSLFDDDSARLKDKKFEITIDRAAAEVVKATDENQKILVFTPQTFASKERCEEVMKGFPGADFVTYSPAIKAEALSALLTQQKYKDCKKVLITMGMKTDSAFFEDQVFEKPYLFKEIMLINTSGESMRLSTIQKRSLQKGVLTVALLARSLPKKGYEKTNAYETLMQILNLLLEDRYDAETYIATLVGASHDKKVILTIERYQYLIDAMLKPIVRVNVERLRYIVDIFISA